jgi:hypothetical protein
MARSKIAQKILNETPLSVKRRVRQYADSLFGRSKEEKPSKCTNCKCQDLEDWLSCHSKK